MTKPEKVDHTNDALDMLRAAKHGVTSKYNPSTEEPTIPKGDEANGDTLPSATPDGTPQGTPSASTTSEPSTASKPLTPDATDLSVLEKRISDKDRYITELKQKLTELENAHKEPVKLPKSEEELASWMSRNKEQADLLVTLIAKQNESLAKDIQAARAEFAEIQRKNQNEILFQEVLKTHSDAGQIRASEDFKLWFAEQTPTVQALIESTNSQDIIRGISLYKSDKGITSKSKSAGKSASDADFVSTKSTVSMPQDQKIWLQSEVAKLSEAQYAKHRDEIKAAKREGRYDPFN